jgi:hypothetical protein
MAVYPPPFDPDDVFWRSFLDRCYAPGGDFLSEKADDSCIHWTGPMASAPRPKIGPDLQALFATGKSAEASPLARQLQRADAPFVQMTIEAAIQRPRPTALQPTVSNKPLFRHGTKTFQARTLFFTSLRRQELSQEEGERAERYLRLRSLCGNPRCVHPWHHEPRARKRAYRARRAAKRQRPEERKAYVNTHPFDVGSAVGKNR